MIVYRGIFFDRVCLIGVLRTLLLFCAVSLCVLFFVVGGWFLFEGDEVGFSPPDSVQGMTNEVVRARLVSMREDERLTLSFSQAVQSGDRVRLRGIEAEVDWDGGRVVSIEAEGGVYDLGTRRIDLRGDVRVVYDGDITLQTQAAMIDTRSGLIRGRELTRGQLPLGRIEASGFDIVNFGERLFFLGGVSMVVDREGGD